MPRFLCPGCKAPTEAAAADAGSFFNCQSCGQRMLIPGKPPPATPVDWSENLQEVAEPPPLQAPRPAPAPTIPPISPERLAELDRGRSTTARRVVWAIFLVLLILDFLIRVGGPIGDVRNTREVATTAGNVIGMACDAVVLYVFFRGLEKVLC